MHTLTFPDGLTHETNWKYVVCIIVDDSGTQKGLRDENNGWSNNPNGSLKILVNPFFTQHRLQ